MGRRIMLGVERFLHWYRAKRLMLAPFLFSCLFAKARFFDWLAAMSHCLSGLILCTPISLRNWPNPMANYFYIAPNGQKQGPVGREQLKTLAIQGIITPDTPMETSLDRKDLPDKFVVCSAPLHYKRRKQYLPVDNRECRPNNRDPCMDIHHKQALKFLLQWQVTITDV